MIVKFVRTVSVGDLGIINITICNTRITDKRPRKNKKHSKCKELVAPINAEGKTAVPALEETIPAYVTIKRDSRDDAVPTVTITLKGSTPDQDKLLYKIVNGYSQAPLDAPKQHQSRKKNKNQMVQSSDTEGAMEVEKLCKKKNKNGRMQQEISKEVKVTLSLPSSSVDSSVNKRTNTKQTEAKKKTVVKSNNNNNNSSSSSATSNTMKTAAKEQIKPNTSCNTNNNNNNKDADLNIPMLRLPPGKWEFSFIF